jgi:predicted porin
MFNLGEYSMMKKSLVALAALAATGAFAQSAVTMYGVAEAVVDLGFKNTGSTNVVTSSKNNTTGVITASNVLNKSSFSNKDAFRVSDGGDQGVGRSRIGWRGTEDLGGGLKANYQIEMGVALDQGASAGSGGLVGRQAWVGASGGFGEVRLGRQVVGSWGVLAGGSADGTASGLYSPIGGNVGAFHTGGQLAVLGATSAITGVRFFDAIKYITPNLGGFTGTLTIRAPEGNGDNTAVAAPGVANPPVTTTTSSNKNKIGLDLAAEYANGPIYVGFGYAKVNSSSASGTTIANQPGTSGTSTSTDGGPTKGFTLSGSYNLGVAQPFVNYTNIKGLSSTVTVVTPLLPPTTSTGSSSNANEKIFTVGVKAPFGPVTLISSFSRNKLTNTGTNFNNTGVAATSSSGSFDASGKSTAFNIGAQYALSKRTLVEANYGQIKSTYNLNNVAVAAGGLTSGLTNTDREAKTSALSVGLRHTF